MALLLRLAAALDRRPEARVAGLEVKVSDDQVRIALQPSAAGVDLSLEQWSLQGCGASVLEATGRVLKVH
jgi:exopolyphosphatase/guanosine-5'-triphosphate,3'-diphosphate pyrophosphatase